MLEESLNILNLLHESATAKYGPTRFALQPRGTPFASAHLRDVTGEEKRRRIKLTAPVAAGKNTPKTVKKDSPWL